MSVSVEGVTKIKFTKYNDHETIWMELQSFEAKVLCTIRIPAEQFIEDMNYTMSCFRLALDINKRFDHEFGVKDVARAETETNRV